MGINRPQGGRIRAPDAEQAMLNRSSAAAAMENCDCIIKS